MYMKIKIALFLLSISLWTKAQESSFTLKQAIDLALENHYKSKNADLEVLRAKKKVWETTAIGLPQISANADYQNRIKLPFDFGDLSQIPPGQEFVLLFAAPHNTNANLNFSQLLFDGTYIVGLQAAKTYKGLADVEKNRSRSEVVKEVSNAYFLVLVAKENLDLLDKSYGTLSQNLTETQALLKEGFVEETDVDQLNLLLSDIETKKIESKNQYDIALKMLQLSMGLDVDKSVVLLDDLNSVLNLINLAQLEQSTFNALNNPDFKVLQVQEELLKLDVRRYKMERLPSLGAFYQMSAQAYQVKYDFYRNADWLSSQTAGIQLKLPVFSSGMQGAKIAQAQIQLDKLRNSKSFIEKSLEIQFNNTKNTLQTKQQIFMNAQKNMVLAEKINNKTILKNKEGVASSFDILQSKNQLTEAQAKYIQSLFELLNTKAELDQIQYKEAE